MTLKRQLFVASLLMLLIPWAGLQFVLELDDALREQAASQLENQARRMAAMAEDSLRDQPVVRRRDAVIYADTLERPPNLDGYGDDWPGYDSASQPWQSPVDTDPSDRIAWQAGHNERHLYLLIRVQRPRPVYFDPGAPERPHDYLRLRWQAGNRLMERHIQTPSPGTITGVIPDEPLVRDHRVTGVWQSRSDGYQLELRMPRPPSGHRLGFEVVWPDPQQPELSHTSGTRQIPLPILVSRDPELEQHLEQLLSPGQSVRVREPGGWLIARSSIVRHRERPEFDSLGPLEILEQLSLNGLRALVRFYQPSPVPVDPSANPADPAALPEEGLIRHPDDTTLMMTSVSLADERRLILEQSLDQLLALSGSTLGSVIARSTLLIIGLMLVLLGYASWLSWRITRLQRLIAASVDSNGRILASIPASQSRDELGELNRQFGQMVERLQGYTDYLESFSRRLSHELKTPVAVIRSSLDNLEHAGTGQEQARYRERARAATDRLSQILQGMSEAARLEQSFDEAEMETFDLAAVLVEATAAYQELDDRHRIVYHGLAAGEVCHGSPELIVQLLDKLVDNARDFTPEGGLIEVRLARDPAGTLTLHVFNEGPGLPETLAHDIFNPFVSVREGSGEGHLGQGLLIVRLIADFHGGRVHAGNHRQDHHQGVRFTVELPVSPDRH